MPNFTELVFLCRGQTVYIQTHNIPDPDAIASAFGLQKLLEAFDVSARICYAGQIDKLSAARMLTTLGIEMFPYDALKDQMRQTDYIICVDSQKNGGNITDFIGDEMACIDHHPVFSDAVYQYRDIRSVGACATIIAEYFARSGLKPDRDTATALLYGMKMDTLQFSRGVTPLDIEMFGFLHPLCDQEKLTMLERNQMEIADLRAYGAAIENIKLYGTMGISFIPFSCPDALIAAISDFILALDEVDVAVVCAEREDGIKFSVRSEKPEIHAAHLIRAALKGIGDGGGHPSMAGGLIRKEQLHLLGNYPKDWLESLFLDALAQCGQEAAE